MSILQPLKYIQDKNTTGSTKWIRGIIYYRSWNSKTWSDIFYRNWMKYERWATIGQYPVTMHAEHWWCAVWDPFVQSLKGGRFPLPLD